jgi:dynein light intermediate chain
MQPSQSLVKYDNPVLVSRTDGSKGGKAATGADKKKDVVAAANALKKLPPVDDKGRAKTPNQTEDILNSILPPRYVIHAYK